MINHNPEKLSFTLADYNRMLGWASELSKGDRYNKSDANLAVKIKMMQDVFVHETYLKYKTKKENAEKTLQS